MKIAATTDSLLKVNQTIPIASPTLWSIDKPAMYKAKTKIIQDGKLIDEDITTFGIRSIHFDAQTGFSLNGKAIKLKGGCIHHDNGPLGAAAIDRAEERKIELLKKAAITLYAWRITLPLLICSMFATDLVCWLSTKLSICGNRRKTHRIITSILKIGGRRMYNQWYSVTAIIQYYYVEHW